MKKLTIATLLLIAGAISAEETQRKLVIGKLLNKPDEKPAVDRKPGKPLHKPFPLHWGKPPTIQTRDLKPLPHGFGMGSSTLAKWIVDNLKNDRKDKPEARPERPKRPEPSEEVKAKIATVRLVQKDLAVSRKVLLEQLKNKSKEDAVELIKQFKETQKEKHQELKAARQDLVREVREKVQTGDRRE